MVDRVSFGKFCCIIQGRMLYVGRLHNGTQVSFVRLGSKPVERWARDGADRYPPKEFVSLSTQFSVLDVGSSSCLLGW